MKIRQNCKTHDPMKLNCGRNNIRRKPKREIYTGAWAQPGFREETFFQKNFQKITIKIVKYLFIIFKKCAKDFRKYL